MEHTHTHTHVPADTTALPMVSHLLYLYHNGTFLHYKNKDTEALSQDVRLCSGTSAFTKAAVLQI